MIRLLWIILFFFVSFSYGNIITIKCIKDFNAYITMLIFEDTSIYEQITKFDMIHDYSIFPFQGPSFQKIIYSRILHCGFMKNK